MSLNNMPELTPAEKEFQNLLNNQFNGDLDAMFRSYSLGETSLDKEVEDLLAAARDEQSTNNLEQGRIKRALRRSNMKIAPVPKYYADLLREKGLNVPSDDESEGNIDPNIEI